MSSDAPAATAAPVSTEPAAQGDVPKAIEGNTSVFQKPGLLTFTIAITLAFILFVIATPLPFYTTSTSEFTLWGYRPINGGLTKYSDSTLCDKLLQRFKAAESFAIITIGFSALATLVAFGQIFVGFNGKIIGAILAFFTVGFSLITWGITATMYNESFCNIKLSDSTDYGEGFALFVTGWCLAIVALIGGFF
jgi:hypothetical protein